MPISNLFSLIKAKANVEQTAKYLNLVAQEPQKSATDSKLAFAMRAHERAMQNYFRLGGCSLDLIV